VTLIDVKLAGAIVKALRKAQRKGDLPHFELPEQVPVERPRQEDKGDFATPVCMQLARQARMAPIKIAEAVAGHLPRLPFIGRVVVAHPGFINFHLSEAWLTSQVDEILAADGTYGNIPLGQARKVQVEYVSANPTGPLHIGSARNAVLGDAVASILEAAGYAVQREYYVNDSGSRMRAFNQTLYARYAQSLGRDESVPEDGYHGTYMVDLGAEIAGEYGRRFLEMPRKEALAEVGALGLHRVVDQAREDLATMGVHYDRWFSERSLYDDGQFDRVMTILRQDGHV